MLSKSNPFYGSMNLYLRCIHLAHSTEMKDMLIEKVRLKALAYNRIDLQTHSFSCIQPPDENPCIHPHTPASARIDLQTQSYSCALTH